MYLFKAWISSAADYEQFRRLIRDHTDFPDTYDEWLYVANQQVTHMIKQGYVITKVTVDPAEFTGYCHRMGSHTASLLRVSNIDAPQNRVLAGFPSLSGTWPLRAQRTFSGDLFQMREQVCVEAARVASAN